MPGNREVCQGNTSVEPGAARAQRPVFPKLSLDACRMAAQGVGRLIPVDPEAPPLDDPTTREKDKQRQFIEHLLIITVQMMHPDQEIISMEIPQQTVDMIPEASTAQEGQTHSDSMRLMTVMLSAGL